MAWLDPRSGDHLLLYDGVCGLCNRSVRFLLRHDRAAVLTFAPLQGETARPILERHGLDEEPSTMILVESPGGRQERLRTRSDGALAALDAIGGPWRIVSWLRVVPRPLRDAVYGWVARNRYGWFGRSDTCELPPADFRERFPDDEWPPG